jgi:carbamoyl-phosphate synthase large subunit
MAGKTLAELGVTETTIDHVAVKESVFPFMKFAGVDTILGPEMRSTGEVMGIDAAFPAAFAKSQVAAGNALPDGGRAFLSVRQADKPALIPIARALADLGFTLVATRGTAAFLTAAGLTVDVVAKVGEGRPHCVDAMTNGEIAFVVNTTEGAAEIRDSFSLRRTALLRGISYFTTMRGAAAALSAIVAMRGAAAGVRPLQEYHSKR